jgi:threonine/homoserine/homoserine lactone efflux protein
MVYALIKGITLGLLLSIAVGPILFTIIKQSINNGTRGGLAFVAGVSLSDISLAIASNFFTEVFNSIIERKEIVGMTGSFFLIAVGVYFLFFKKIKSTEDGRQVLKFRKRDYAKLFATGYLMNVLNPLIIAFWLTTSTAFADHSIRQRLIIFSTALVLVLAADLLKVVLANKIRKKLTIKNIQLISRLNGIVLIGFGIALLSGLLFFSDKFSH